MSLLLDTEKHQSLPEAKKVLYLLQWLQGLPQSIKDASKVELKSKHKALAGQLQTQLHGHLGPPLRRALGQAFVSLYESGETVSLYETVGKCCDVVKTKEEASGATNNKLCALECLGAIYERHGRMAGSSFPETVQVLSKGMKNQELRSAILSVFRHLLVGLGFSSSSAHKDIYKCIKSGLGDKNLTVRTAAAECALELSQHSSFLYSNELDSFSNNCLRALDGSSYEVRCSVAKLLGSLIALTQKPLPREVKGRFKVPSLEEALGILSNGFIRGASGFLKVGGPELLKTGSASREVRVGVTQTYVVFLTEMGGGWVERHVPLIAKHILELVAHPKTTSTHIDAVYSRKCVSFILRYIFSRLLGESAQLAAAGHLSAVTTQTVMNITRTSSSSSSLKMQKSFDEKTSEGNSSGNDKDKDKMALQQHMVICTMFEIGALVYNLNTAALPVVVGDSVSVMSTDELVRKPPMLLSALTSVLSLPYLAPRLAGAWCMRCIGLALPSQLTLLVDYCLSQLKEPVRSADIVSGHTHAVAGLLGTVRYSNLGLPSAKAKEVLSLGQRLVEVGRTEKGTEKHNLTCIQSGWTLVGAFVSLGSVYVRSQLRPLLTAWRASFPRSTKEMNAELTTGTLTSWLITLENRAGALSSICSFVRFCGDLLTPELTRRLMLPLDSALAMLSGLPGIAKAHGVQLKASGAMLRLRLYQALSLLDPSAYEGSLNALLREVVTEFTLSNSLANTSTSLLRSMCHRDDSILLGSWLEETDHQDVEEQLQPNSAAGSGALEHDTNSVFMAEIKGTRIPDPLPLGVGVIDSSILLFGKAFPAVAHKHRQQLLSHFKECVRQAKSIRQQVIQINIFTAFLAALKNLVDSKSSLGQQDLLMNAYELIRGALESSEPMLRCAAGEALGRMSQVGGDTNFVAQIAQASFDSLKSNRDVVSRTGHSLVLGCLHRYVGGMGSGQHLQMSVSILHSLTQDTASPTVQVWALHALALVADSGGPMFRNYVELTLTLMLHLLVTTPPSYVEVHQCLAKCLSALITTIGPELQDTSQSMNATRKTCLTCCAIVQEHPDAIVQSAAIGCLQQLQLFAPQYVTLPIFVPRLYSNLNSSHLLLRRAAANCLRQFTQREPKAVWSIQTGEEEKKGLEFVVLSKLDVETDPKLCEDLEEILFSLLTSLAPDDPMRWLKVCNQVLAASGDKSAVGEGVNSGQGAYGDSKQQEDDDEDAAKFTTGESEESQRATKISPRWPTKVFAVECSRKIYAVCKSDPAHFDLSLAQKRKRERQGGDYLVMHLSELVRTSFIAATASVDQLKLAGYKALRDVIELFAATPDPEFPGHLLLEQYQAQIGAALRPAFTPETAPHVTAMACQVCSEWLGSGVSRDVGDLKRVQQLLVSSLEKMSKERKETSFYGESVATMEGLAVLKAWAELYIKVTEDILEESDHQASAMELLNPHLSSLSQYWLAALKDYAYLCLPPEFNSQLPSSGGTFYSLDVMDTVRPYYEVNWSSLLHAAAIWLKMKGLDAKKERNNSSFSKPLTGNEKGASLFASLGDVRLDDFHLAVGLAVQSLCVSSTLDQPLTIANCLSALKILISSDFATRVLTTDDQLPIELLSVLHRMLLTCQTKSMHVLALQIAHLIGNALLQSYKTTPREMSDDQVSASKDKTKHSEGVPEWSNSCAYALLKVSACCLLRLIPGLKSLDSSTTPPTSTDVLTKDDFTVISLAVSLLVTSTSLCPGENNVTILPSVLHMLLYTLQYTSRVSLSSDSVNPSATGLQALRQLCTSLPLAEEHSGMKLLEIVRSAFASVLETESGVGGQSTVMTSAMMTYPGMDQETRLLVMAVLLLMPIGPVELIPPKSDLFQSCVSLLVKCLTCSDVKIQVKALQTCKSIFSMGASSQTSVHLIHALGTQVMSLIEGCREDGRVDLAVIVEATQVLEALLDSTADANRSQMMNILLPLYVSVLVEPSTLHTVTKQRRQIHDHILKHVTLIGPKYPEAFRSVMQGSPDLNQRLKMAIQANQSVSQRSVTSVGERKGGQLQQAPSIKLKMDFSNFK